MTVALNPTVHTTWRATLPARLWLTALSFAAVACGGDTDGANNNAGIRSVTTTVGDTLVVRTTGEIPDAGTHTLTELWRIGDADGVDTTISFGSIGEFALKPDGTVAVYDYTGPTVRTYDASGRYLRSVGRKGAGPGEYSQNNGMTYLADGRLALWDPSTARITLYDDDGRVQSEWKPPVTGSFSSNALSMIASHALAVNASLRENSPDDAPPTPSRTLGQPAYFLYDSTGTITDTLRVPKPLKETEFISAEREGMSIMYAVPFAPLALDALRPDGQLVVTFSREYSIDISNGARPIRIERDIAFVPTTEGERAGERAIVEYQFQRSMPDWRWQGATIPDVKPAIRSLKSAADNRLWVRISAPGELIPESERAPQASPAVAGSRPPRPVALWREPSWYDVFEPSGEFFARIVMPPRSRLLGARGDLAWGVVTDEDDVPFLVHWRITPTVAAP